MEISTQDKILEVAEALYAENGFYGTSINDVAAQLSLTKQGVLHYFPTKAKLYGAVLEKAANTLSAQIEQVATEANNFQEVILSLFKDEHWEDEQLIRVVRLIIRELLDNQGRADHSNQWYMKEFIDAIQKLITNGQKSGEFRTDIDGFALIYGLLGAHQYFLISLPTLKRIHSAKAYKLHLKAHSETLRQIIKASLVV